LQDTSGLPENEAMKRKALVLKENSKILMKDLLENPRSGEKIKEVRNTGQGDGALRCSPAGPSYPHAR
ncbi:MAG: hypothetical protein K8I29_02300, partial [Alphaproteobacteria bacterium]|nr:hypothetical protein [Candidatus Nitrobium versatile]